ncbi:MAG: o-succinylbenzoate synthase, partial [Thermomicrobium sp.]|nr:o-succinylbenzoate synthase [Thermomicrobium sp.]
MSGLSLRWWPYRLALRRPLRSASGCILERRGFVLELRAADGARGFGDVAVWPGTESTTLPDARAWLDAFAAPDWLQCERTLWSALERLPASTAGARAARAAVETALLDLGARRSGIPLARALDAAAGSAVAVNALIGVAEVEETVALARAAVAAGFETVKLKVRIEPSDAERIAAVRAAIGPTVRIRLDANGLASVAQARAFAQAVAPVGIEYLEQPVATLEELAELRRCSPVPVAADEVLTGPEAVQRALDREAVDALVLKLPVLGGPLR